MSDWSAATGPELRLDGEEEGAFRVHDRRHSAQANEPDADEPDEAPVERIDAALVDELRRRADDAERKTREYAEAFRAAQTDLEQVRERLTRDVDRKVALQFGSLVAELVESLDDIELALAHASGKPEGKALAEGVALARTRFLHALQKAGVERLDPVGTLFDPTIAEAVRLAPVDDRDQDGVVVETLRPGYLFGERVIRPAQVAVGRHGG